MRTGYVIYHLDWGVFLGTVENPYRALWSKLVDSGISKDLVPTILGANVAWDYVRRELRKIHPDLDGTRINLVAVPLDGEEEEGGSVGVVTTEEKLIEELETLVFRFDDFDTKLIYPFAMKLGVDIGPSREWADASGEERRSWILSSPEGQELWRKHVEREGWRTDGLGERMVALARSFPTLAHTELCLVLGWNVSELVRFNFSGAATGGSRYATAFVANVWNDSLERVLPFNVVHAFSAWDQEHRNAFLAWAQKPWWA